MIQFAENLFVGRSHDERHANYDAIGITAVLNVAHDLQSTRGWDRGIEYAQVGLIDGPGNPLAAYAAAVLALAMLLKRHKKVMVCCHKGESRSVSVAIMYLHLAHGHGWDGTIDMVRDRSEIDLPQPHIAHLEAFNRIDWKLLSSLVR